MKASVQKTFTATGIITFISPNTCYEQDKFLSYRLTAFLVIKPSPIISATHHRNAEELHPGEGERYPPGSGGWDLADGGGSLVCPALNVKEVKLRPMHNRGYVRV